MIMQCCRGWPNCLTYGVQQCVMEETIKGDPGFCCTANVAGYEIKNFHKNDCLGQKGNRRSSENGTENLDERTGYN